MFFSKIQMMDNVWKMFLQLKFYIPTALGFEKDEKSEFEP